MEGTSTEEGLLMREIEDLPVVSSLSFIRVIGRVKPFLHTRTSCRFSIQGHHVMLFFYFSWYTEALFQDVVQLLVQGMFACARSRTRMQLLWTKSHGGRLYTHEADLLDRRPVCSHSISRDSGSRHEGCRDCDEGTTKGQT
jgi:hypothetical protein